MPKTIPAQARSLPRRTVKWYGWKPSLPDERDARFAYRPRIAEQPRAASLEPALLPPTRNQGEEGSCTGHATRGIGQYLRKLERQSKHELSPGFIYYNGRVIEGTEGEDSGCMIRDVVRSVAELGFAREVDCRYRAGGFARKPSAKAYSGALKDVAVAYRAVRPSVQDLKQAILDKRGFIFGFSVYENFDDIGSDGLMPMPAGRLEGGHAVFAVSSDDDKQIRDQVGGVCIQNSWDTDWGCQGPNGQGGYFWMPWRYITNPDLADDFWLLDKIS